MGCLTARRPQARPAYPPGRGPLVNRTARAALRNARSPGVVRHASESGTKGNTAVASLDSITPARAATRPGTAGSADLVLRNGRIFTGDPARPQAVALAVSAGRITAVGDEADIAALAGPGTRVVDALGRRVIPGLNDSHIHLIRGGVNYLLELRWDGVSALSLALRMLREQAQRTPPGHWVRVVGGWTGAQFAEKRLPTVFELNAAAPDTPVLVLHLYQSAILNRAAITALGYTKDTPDPPGGQIVRDHADNPTGVLLATPAAIMQLARSGDLSVRIAYRLLPQTAGNELRDLAQWAGTMRIGDGDEWLRLNGAGEALTLSTADFENFCEPRPELPGAALDDFEQAVRVLAGNDRGFRLHASYGETIDCYLEIFDVFAAEGMFHNGTRWFFDHAETASQRSLERIVALGGAISVQNRTVMDGDP